ncbi:TBC1 domain family member 10B-like [Physella acuta]|uniref:TBC1 domain family member 10B-like n=1 Tax=Physella acuta TaxID=109671 RepID=UPI0027DAFD81|nr:TBC1 domain family member 10B-like [Physella acuta]XP_059174340.1 TBC1 domain family member 10B-like [Physella acuta]
MAMAYPPSANGDAGSPRSNGGSPSGHELANGDLADPDSSTVTTDRYGFLGGNQYTDPDMERRLPQEKLRKRETKWLDMFINWDKWMSKRFKKVRERCRKGVPPSLRARAWQHLCGSNFTMEQNKGLFESYLRLPGDPKCIDDINKDLDRQFPLHEMFLSKGGVGQESLFEVLKAYTIHRPIEGYCQAQAPIAALLLMHMPVEQAFWCLVAICDKYITGYYSPGLEAIQLDGDVLFGLLKKTSPGVYKHMRKQHIEPIMFMTEWFMCVYTRTLPWTIVLRLWDQFLCEGVKVLFRVGLVLLKVVLEGQEKLAQCPTFFETLEKLRLRNLPHELQDEDFLFRESLRLGISERDMEREHQKQIARRKAAREAKEKESLALSGQGPVGRKDVRQKKRS